ncbi:hypothetical protein [Methylocella sp.]|uniref:hypothetical protein n=1 Tax=Methylocella sp. TaxID=1978226 RepID=UPI003783066E
MSARPTSARRFACAAVALWVVALSAHPPTAPLPPWLRWLEPLDAAASPPRQPCFSRDDCDRKDFDESGTRGRMGLGASPFHPEGPGNFSD